MSHDRRHSRNMEVVLYHSHGIFCQKFKQCFFSNIIASFVDIVVTWTCNLQATDFHRCWSFLYVLNKHWYHSQFVISHLAIWYISQNLRYNKVLNCFISFSTCLVMLTVYVDPVSNPEAWQNVYSAADILYEQCNLIGFSQAALVRSRDVGWAPIRRQIWRR